MNHAILPAVLLVAASGSTAFAAEPRPQGHYCKLSVFTPAELTRLKELPEKLASGITGRSDLEKGYSFRFSGELKEIGEFVDLVRRCCPTLKYHVSYESQLGPVSIDMTGEDNAREFIHEEFKRLFEKSL